MYTPTHTHSTPFLVSAPAVVIDWALVRAAACWAQQEEASNEEEGVRILLEEWFDYAY